MHRGLFVAQLKPQEILELLVPNKSYKFLDLKLSVY